MGLQDHGIGPRGRPNGRRRSHAYAASTAAALIAMFAHTPRARALDDVLTLGSFSLDVAGMIEGRAAAGSTTRSWEDKGLGKVRYGADAAGGRRTVLRPEGALVLRPKFGFDLTGTVVATANDQQRMALDISEAFLTYKPAPSGEWAITARGGAFFPPISAENGGLAWTSPYTITSSAINSWVGEELKTIGAEATIHRRTEDYEFEFLGALYMLNDPTGTLLAWRGWSFNDRETGFFDRLQLAPVRMIRPGGRLDEQAPTEKPFHEIDENVGFYIGASLDHADYGRLALLYYDNLADDRDLIKGQWAWRTKFASASYKVELAGDITLVGQFMLGTTSTITIPAPRGPIVYAGFRSGYGLLSKEWGRHRLSLRGDYFAVGDRDITPGEDNSETGGAATAAYVFRPVPSQRITFEVMYVSSKRPERIHLGMPARAKESQAQLSYRFFF